MTFIESTRRLLAIAFVTAVLFVPVRVSGETGRAVRLGFITDLSGIGSYWGDMSRVGLEMAREDIARSGGRLEIIAGDHTFKPAAAVSEAQKMLSVDGVDALWVEFAPTAVAASALAVKAKRLYLNNSAATSILESNPYAFKAYLDYERGCREIAEYWRQQGVSRAGMIKLNSEFAELCYLGARSIFPELRVTPYDFSQDVSSQVMAMKSAGVQGVFNVGLESDMLNMLKALRVIRYFPRLGVAEPDALTPSVLASYRDDLYGVSSFGFPPIAADFVAKLSAVTGDPKPKTPEAAAMAYTHARQIYLAIAGCPKGDVNCAVRAMEASPPDSTMAFRAWRNRIADYSYALKHWSGGSPGQVKESGL